MGGTYVAHTRCPCSPSGTDKTPLDSCPRSYSSHCTLTLWAGSRAHTGKPCSRLWDQKCPAWLWSFSKTSLETARAFWKPLTFSSRPWGGGSFPAHLGSPRSWGPASHQRRHRGWVGNRSPGHRRAYRWLESSRQQSRPGSSAIPTPRGPGGLKLCWSHGETEVFFGPEPLSSKDRSWRVLVCWLLCWGGGQ